MSIQSSEAGKDNCSLLYKLSHLLQICVGPRLPVRESLQADATILIVLHAHRHGAPLNACHVPTRRVCDIYAIEADAGCPKGGPASVVIVDAQCELPVVVVNLLSPGDAVEIHGQQIAIVYLSGRWRYRQRVREKEKERGRNRENKVQ